MYGSPDLLRPLAENLRQSGWEVVIPDLYKDRVGPYTFEQYVAHATKEASALVADGVPPIVIGHSMGGLIGQVLASRRLASSLVLICSAPPRGIMAISWKILKAFPRYLKHMVRGTHYRPPRKDAESFLFNRLPEETVGEYFEALREEGGYVLRQLFLGVAVRNISCPVLCMIAGDDEFIPPRIGKKIARRHRAEVAIYEGRGHYLPVEDPHGVAKRISGWLSRI